MSILMRHAIYVIDQGWDSVLTKQIESNCKNNQLTGDSLKEGPRKDRLEGVDVCVALSITFTFLAVVNHPYQPTRTPIPPPPKTNTLPIHPVDPLTDPTR